MDRWSTADGQDIAGCQFDDSNGQLPVQDGNVFRLLDTTNDDAEVMFKIWGHYRDCYSTGPLGIRQCYAPAVGSTRPPDPHWFYSTTNNGHDYATISHADYLDGFGNGGNKIRTSGNGWSDAEARYYAVVLDGDGNDAEIVPDVFHRVYNPFFYEAGFGNAYAAGTTCHLSFDPTQVSPPPSPPPPLRPPPPSPPSPPYTPFTPSPPPNPPAPPTSPQAPNPPYAPYPPLPAIQYATGRDPDCSGVSLTNTYGVYESNAGTTWPCAWKTDNIGTKMHVMNMRYGYEQYFTDDALDKHRPKFRYEISSSVRQCSDNQNRINEGYLNCAALGISGAGSVFDYYQSGYVSQAVWNDEWYFSTEQDPNEREVSWVGKLDCGDAWCFYTDAHGSFQNRCHWYVRFVERRGDEGQFDYGSQRLLIRDDVKPASVAVPLYVPAGTFYSQDAVDLVCS